LSIEASGSSLQAKKTAIKKNTSNHMIAILVVWAD
jgi:hypothetical protein